MIALRICVLLCASTEQFPNKSVLSRRFQSHPAICNRCFIWFLGGYIFHHCKWDSGERNEKSIQHESSNCILDLMCPENCAYANNLGQHAVL